MEMALEVMPCCMACINVCLVTLWNQDLALGAFSSFPTLPRKGVPRVGSPLLNDGVVFLAFPQVGGFRSVGGPVRMLHKTTLLHSAQCQKGKSPTQPSHRYVLSLFTPCQLLSSFKPQPRAKLTGYLVENWEKKLQSSKNRFSCDSELNRSKAALTSTWCGTGGCWGWEWWDVCEMGMPWDTLQPR